MVRFGRFQHSCQDCLCKWDSGLCGLSAKHGFHIDLVAPYIVGQMFGHSALNVKMEICL